MFPVGVLGVKTSSQLASQWRTEEINLSSGRLVYVGVKVRPTHFQNHLGSGLGVLMVMVVMLEVMMLEVMVLMVEVVVVMVEGMMVLVMVTGVLEVPLRC